MQEGGWAMWVALASAFGVGLLQLVAFVLAAVAMATGNAVGIARAVAVVGTLAAAVPLLVGVLGWWSGRSAVDEALTYLDPAQIDMVRDEGYREARHPLELGGGAACVLAGFGAAALVVSLVARPKGQEAA